MRISLPLNLILALVSHGLCDSQYVMMFWHCLVMVASLVSCGGYSEFVGIEMLVVVSLSMCNYLQGIVE
jgi:hypothetical protein